MVIIVVTCICIQVTREFFARGRYVAAVRKHITAGERVLDFGCGPCSNAKNLAHNEIINLDIADHNGKNCDMMVYDGKTIPFRENHFDVALVVFVLHHIPDQEKSLRELRRVSKRMIVLEDLPSSNPLHPSHIVSRMHYLSFDQPPSMVEKMHTVDEWISIFKRTGWKTTSIQKISGSFVYPCNHVMMLSE